MTNSFALAWKENQERIFTENGAATFNTSASSAVDLFFKIGAMRGQDKNRLYQSFAKAFGENSYVATRILLWARDVRGGAGERQIFRDLLVWLEDNQPEVLKLILPKVPELGRWDDLLVFTTSTFKTRAYDMFETALRAKDGLAAKWAPRENSKNHKIAMELRKHLGLTPRQYRQVLSKLSNTVEQLMCAKDWDAINYQHVPSLAQARYSKAFLKHDESRYREFGEKAKVYAETKAKVESGELDASALEKIEKVTINAGAVYPYDVLKDMFSGYGYRAPSANKDVIRAQWATLPNYMGSKKILPMIDVSGSMYTPAGSQGSTSCLQVAVSLGLYMATKNTGDFGNMFLTFSNSPTLVTLKGTDIISLAAQVFEAPMGYNTNLGAAFDKVLDLAKRNRVPQEDLPEYILVLSDMEFDAFGAGNTAFEAYTRKFEEAGYTAPKIIWWNIQSRQDQSPVKFNQQGAALVSGFSPSIAKSIMTGESIDPYKQMLAVIMNERYDIPDLAEAV